MFAYCGNNPINATDASGQIWGLIVGFVATVLVLPLLTSCESKDLTEEQVDEYDMQINQGKSRYTSTDEAAIALADEAFNEHHDELGTNEFAASIRYDESQAAYVNDKLVKYGGACSFAGDMNKDQNVASFHTHTVQQLLGFSGDDIRLIYSNIIHRQSRHIEYLLHKNNDKGIYELIKYDPILSPYVFNTVVVKTYD